MIRRLLKKHLVPALLELIDDDDDKLREALVRVLGSLLSEVVKVPEFRSVLKEAMEEILDED